MVAILSHSLRPGQDKKLLCADLRAGWQMDLASGKELLGFFGGLYDVSTRWVVAHRIALWSDEIAFALFQRGGMDQYGAVRFCLGQGPLAAISRDGRVDPAPYGAPARRRVDRCDPIKRSWPQWNVQDGLIHPAPRNASRCVGRSSKSAETLSGRKTFKAPVCHRTGRVAAVHRSPPAGSSIGRSTTVRASRATRPRKTVEQ
jgi:hypothetical protein